MTLLQTSTSNGRVVLEGEIDLAVADRVIETLQTAAASGITTVDLAAVTFMDSTGLYALVRAARSLNGQGPLRLRRPSRAVRKVLDIAMPDGAPELVIVDDDR